MKKRKDMDLDTSARWPEHRGSAKKGAAKRSPNRLVEISSGEPPEPPAGYDAALMNFVDHGHEQELEKLFQRISANYATLLMLINEKDQITIYQSAEIQQSLYELVKAVDDFYKTKTKNESGLFYVEQFWREFFPIFQDVLTMLEGTHQRIGIHMDLFSKGHTDYLSNRLSSLKILVSLDLQKISQFKQSS